MTSILKNWIKSYGFNAWMEKTDYDTSESVRTYKIVNGEYVEYKETGKCLYFKVQDNITRKKYGFAVHIKSRTTRFMEYLWTVISWVSRLRYVRKIRPSEVRA